MQRSAQPLFRVVTVATFVTIGFLLVGLGWSVGDLNARKSHRADQTAQQYAGHTKERVQKECFGSDRGRILECVQEIVTASRDAQQAEYDLSAQEAMADFALWMVVVSVAGLVLSLAGLVALYFSLAQTRTAIRDNREIGEAQVRAYIGPPEVRARLETTDTGVWFHIEAFLSNSGNSPAVLPSVTCYVKSGDSVLNFRHSRLERDVAAGEKDFRFLNQGHPVREDMRAQYWGGYLIFEGVIRYHTVFGGQHKTTNFRLLLSGTQEGDGPLRVRVHEYFRDGRTFEHHRD